MKNARMQAYIAEKLSELLLEKYQNKHLPRMVQEFNAAGFTKRALLKNPRQIFMMLIVATYDRRPFTASVGEHEYIWGIKDKNSSLPIRLTALGLSDPAKINAITQKKTKELLKKEKINDLSLDTDGFIDYSKMLHNAAFSWENLENKIMRAGSSKDITNIFNVLIHIHGIGDAIASKLIKTLYREIGIGNVKSHEFPLSVVWPLINEFHTDQAITKLRRVGADIVPLTMGVLFEKGDPFALDALFYLNRYEPETLETFISDMNLIEEETGDGIVAVDDVKALSMDKAELLLGIIKEIRDEVNEITTKELGGVVQKSILRVTSDKIYRDMKKIALSGQVDKMYLYYQKCLTSKTCDYDWIIEKAGRKSMSSQWEIFQSVFNDKK